MRKIYSLVLLATALLIGTNAWAVYPAGWLQDQFDAIEADGQTHTITMEDDIVLTAPVYLGTKTVDEERKSIILDMNGQHITMSATDWVNSHPNVYCHMFIITHGELLVRNNASDKATNPSLIQMTGTGYDKYNNIFNVAGSYKSSRWQKSGNDYAVPADAGDEKASVGINTRDKGWFTHLEIGEGVKLVADNTIAGAGITMDGYHGNNKALVSSAESYVHNADGTFGSTGLKPNNAKFICLYGRSDAPAYNTAVLYGPNDGVAYGLRVDVYGDIEFATAATSGKSYGIKLNGGLRSSLKENEKFMNKNCWQMDEAYAKTYANAVEPTSDKNTQEYTVTGDYYTNHKLDTIDAPFLYVHSSAHISAAAELNEATAVYCSGYGKALIEGACSGNSGVNVKSGRVELHDAEITCTATPTSVYTAQNGNNATGTGAVVVNSVDKRAGDIEVIISGDSKVSTDYGYAIAETVTANNDGTKVTSIVIEGGTIQGGAATETTGGGAILVSETTKNNDDAEVVIYGANLTGNNEVVAGGGTLNDLLPKNEQTSEVEGHVTQVLDPATGKTTLVISAGGAPETQEGDDPTPWSWCADNAQSGKNVAWTKIEDDAEIASGTVTLGELQIISGSTGNLQQLTINSGATLQVNHLIMNDYARIIVKAGGSLIIKGKQGIVAPKVENIVLEASETAQALFLFHPEVESNRHPNATVEFISNSITDNPFFSKQRFGIPTWKKLSSITTKNGGNNVQTAIASFSFEANDWIDVSWINIDGKDENLNLIANPFEYYQMQHNTANAGTVVTMTGELYGNTNPTLPILGNSWNGYANSYMAPINGQILIELIPDEVDKSFQIYELVDGAKGHWVPVSNLALADINPMQAFLIGNTKEAANVTVDYWDAVYTPITGEAKPTPNAAPVRRSTLSNITKAKMIVRGEGYKDGVVLAQGDQFSAEFDNSYDCRKYMNEGINLYVSADEKMGIYATDNLENTYVGFQSVNGGTYTIEFTDVQGEELTLIDHETGAQVAIVNGNVYEFTANGTNDYRFEVITAPMMPTAIENAEAVKSAKGIYTITGQFMGEMSVWNSLPAGVYVVNGEKRVK